ncbi:MAG: Helix-turn-helix domain [Phycisphaerales bacterium]|nr:Helix-turn-helix domain [Phycisphaerales bacterium]
MPIDLAKLKRAREKAGLSQEEAALAAGLSAERQNARQRWNSIETGRKSDVRISTIDRIAAALGVKAGSLLK